MAVNDHFLLTLAGRAVTSLTQIDNTFVYEGVSGLCTAADLADAFFLGVLTNILNVCSVEYRAEAIVVINLDNPADYTSVVADQVGTQTGEYLPIYNSWAFKLHRTTRAIQNGRKAIGIIAETSQQNGEATSGMLVSLGFLAAALLANKTGGTPSSTFAPRLWRRPGTYESGTVTAPGLFYAIGDVSYERISTQSTRKIGRGS